MTRRSGLSLLEVIVALAIFVGALAIISQLVSMGVRASRYARLQTRAILLAESKLAEVVAGITPVSAGGVAAFPEDPAWQWQLSSTAAPVDGLTWVTVTVAPSPTGELGSNRDRIEYSLSRWLLEPASDMALAGTTGGTP